MVLEIKIMHTIAPVSLHSSIKGSGVSRSSNLSNVCPIFTVLLNLFLDTGAISNNAIEITHSIAPVNLH